MMMKVKLPADKMKFACKPFTQTMAMELIPLGKEVHMPLPSAFVEGVPMLRYKDLHDEDGEGDEEEPEETKAEDTHQRSSATAGTEKGPSVLRVATTLSRKRKNGNGVHLKDSAVLLGYLDTTLARAKYTKYVYIKITLINFALLFS